MNRTTDALGLVPAVALFAIMLLTFSDVVGRKLFGHSITGSVELTELLQVIMVFAILPATSLLGGHVVFDLLDRVLLERLQRIVYRLSNGATGLVFAAAAWAVSLRAERTLEYGDMTSQYGITLWPFHYMIAIALLLTALAHGYLAVTGRRITLAPR
ncbi:TRAP transporter small permease [Oceanibacterium hippocampi]|uniref:TRAP transporter small permease protein n=1 Tax=Oceanibacterium hippocampi TaxID=745714 RepID=A0A1Y5TY82_9PROT|nr:TRAP transporter small permease [Oceanibacterium hippocampi]SLN71005.1 Tripartite ATP-independent periplasmic transporters, DctQ component [Oceanibacterium hippocampi]